MLAGCAHDVLPTGQAAYNVVAPPRPGASAQDYRLGPLDTINITVFQEPDLSVKEAQIDASGMVNFPLIGAVPAAQRTAAELAHDIAERLNSRYLINPQVSVSVVDSVSQKVTVEGNVQQPGVYDVEGNMTLLRALALARSPTRVAATDKVVIFRTVNGQKMGAIFDVGAIRRGKMADPQILGNDVVVVGFSALKGSFRDILSVAPALATFAVIL